MCSDAKTRVRLLLALFALAALFGSGCSKKEEELPVNAKVTADGSPAPPGSENAPAAPGMDTGGRKGKGGP